MCNLPSKGFKVLEVSEIFKMDALQCLLVMSLALGNGQYEIIYESDCNLHPGLPGIGWTVNGIVLTNPCDFDPKFDGTICWNLVGGSTQPVNVKKKVPTTGYTSIRISAGIKCLRSVKFVFATCTILNLHSWSSKY